MRMNKLNIQEVAYHRNGVMGEGFYAVRFGWTPEDATSDEAFLGILFDQPGQCAIIGLDRVPTMGVAFARGNSWRGDHFESELRAAIANNDSAGGVRIGPFCVPTDDSEKGGAS